MKKIHALVLMLAGLVLAAGCATPFDFQGFTRDGLFPCLHPDTQLTETVFVKAPYQENDTQRARLKLYYKGWLKNHSMTVDVSQRAGLVKAEVLDDTAVLPSLRKRRYLVGWQPWPQSE